MKKHKSLSSSICLLILSIYIFTIQSVYATVGGETLIGNFKYNPANESVYYVLADGSGRGCPPQLVSLSLNSGKTSLVFSCNDGEKISLEQVNSKIHTITEGFKPLVPLSFKKNLITIDVNFVKDKTYGDGSNEIMLRHFTASIYQNGKKIKEFPMTGCYIDQPFTFQGYSIPGFNKKIILLVSAINNCAEGGYVHESLQIVGGVDNLDKQAVDNFHKGMFPLSPNNGNLVIYESDKVNTVNSAIKENLISTSTTINAEPANQSVSLSVTLPNDGVTTESILIRIIKWFRGLF